MPGSRVRVPPFPPTITSCYVLCPPDKATGLQLASPRQVHGSDFSGCADAVDARAEIPLTWPDSRARTWTRLSLAAPPVMSAGPAPAAHRSAPWFARSRPLARVCHREMDREAHAAAANHASRPKKFYATRSASGGCQCCNRSEDVTRLPTHPRRHAGAARGDPAARMEATFRRTPRRR